MTKFRVTLSFDVDIETIDVPDSDAIEAMSASKEGKSAKVLPREELAAAMRKKGMSDEQIHKALADKSPRKKPPNYQMLLYPEYEQWAAAQQRLQNVILSNESLSADYVREVARDLLRGRMDALVDAACGEPSLLEVLQRGVEALSEGDRDVLRADQQGLLFDETELLDNSVQCRFHGISVDPA